MVPKAEFLHLGLGLMKGLAFHVDPRGTRPGIEVFRWFSDLPEEDQQRDVQGLDARRGDNEHGEISFPLFFVKSELDNGDIFDPQPAPGPLEDPDGFREAIKGAMYHAAAVRGLIVLEDCICIGWVVVADKDIFEGRRAAVTLLTRGHYQGLQPSVSPVRAREDFISGDPLWDMMIKLEAMLNSIEGPEEFQAVGDPTWNLSQYELFTEVFGVDPNNMDQWEKLQSYFI